MATSPAVPMKPPSRGASPKAWARPAMWGRRPLQRRAAPCGSTTTASPHRDFRLSCWCSPPADIA
jgi:hypothetical protein